MAAEVETMMYVKKDERDVPWHRLGTPVPDVATAKDAMAAAGLEWSVEKLQAFTTSERVAEPIEIPDTFAIVRDRDNAVLGVVGSQYEIVQPSECFELMDAVVDSGEAKYDTAGSLRGGKTIFMAMKIPSHIMVGGVDRVDEYLVCTNTYDGSRTLTVVATPIRVVCMNTLSMALAGADRAWSIKHNSLMQVRIENARTALEITFSYMDRFEEEANRLINSSFSMAEFEAFAASLFPAAEEHHPNREKQLALIGAFETSATIDESFRYTRWGALQATSEYLDWFAPVRNTKLQSAEERRWSESMFGKGAELRDRAYGLLSAN